MEKSQKKDLYSKTPQAVGRNIVLDNIVMATKLKWKDLRKTILPTKLKTTHSVKRKNTVYIH